MRCYPFRCIFLLFFVFFVPCTWIITRDADSKAVPDLQFLYDRLSVAEELGGQVSRNLSCIIEVLRIFSKDANVTNPTRNTTNTISTEDKSISYPTGAHGRQVYHQPNIYLYMPHLRQHPDSLVPNILIGKGRRGVSMVLGIPTVKRDKQSYLIGTINSLLYNLTVSQRLDVLIIVFVAEMESDYVGSIAETIRKNFPNDVQSGLLEVISPSRYYYPDFTNLTVTFGDSKDRVKWRTKQNLDYSFLMLYAQDRGTYYVQLEDDVVAKAGYYDKMKTFATEEATKPWFYLEFSQLGFIGKMFQTPDLPMIAEFFLMFHRDKPIDWLLDHILWVKVCNPEKDAVDCKQQKALLKQRYKPSLFQHTGLHSSLPGKLQHLKDQDFGKQTLFQAHKNPTAQLNSSLQHYKQHSLVRAYRGEDFFWALTPNQGDYILIKFPKPIHISGYTFRSGNIEAIEDIFYNTTVQVLPSNVSKQDTPVNLTSHYKESEGFIIIGGFENGVAEGEIEEALQPISALRLVVHSNFGVWSLLSEIHIKI